MIGQTIPIQILGVAGPTVLLHDTFTDTNGVNLTAHTMDVGGGWTAGSGTFTISGNRAVGGAPFSQMYYFADAGQANYSLTCEVTLGPSGSASSAVCVRVTDADNLWTVELFKPDDTLTLYQRTGGTLTLRAQTAVTISYSGTYTIGVVTDGNTISATFDGGNQINYGSATQGNTSTLCGLTQIWTTNQSWDDFEVTAA